MKLLKGNTYFWVFGGIALTLMVVSFVLPPTGVIDPSALDAVGWIFAFAALGTIIKAIDKGIDAKVTKGDTCFELNNDEGK